MSDDGIRVNGKPLKSYLDRGFKDDSNINESFIDNAFVSGLPKKFRHTNYKTNSEPNGKVKIFSRKEIIMETGLIPYEVGIDKVIYVIIEAGPVTVSEIAKYIGIDKIRTISAKVATFWKQITKKGIHIVKREKSKDHGCYVYSGVGIPADEAIRLYHDRKPYGNTKSETALTVQTQETTQIKNNDKPKDFINTNLEKGISNFISKLVGEDIDVNININVTVQFKLK